MQNSLKHALQVCVAVGVAAVPMIAAAFMQHGGGPARVAVYASVGEELITFSADTERATLTKQSSIMLPGFVQEAWVSPSGPFLYVAWSNGGASYAGSGVNPVGDKHGITAFRVDSTGALREHGAPAAIRSRPIYVTGDRSARHLLVAYNDPSGISVHAINADGTVGAEISQSGSLDVGIYAHNVRVLPGNDAVVLVTRGNEPTSTTKEDPGALKVFRFDNGTLTNTASIAPSNGIGFRSRHLDFHPTRPWAFLTLEAQNRLEVFGIAKGTVTSQPLFNKATPDAVKDAAKTNITKRLGYLNDQLAKRQYLVGDAFTAADAYAFTILNWTNFVGMDLKAYPNVAAYSARVAARPKVQEALRAEGLMK